MAAVLNGVPLSITYYEAPEGWTSEYLSYLFATYLFTSYLPTRVWEYDESIYLLAAYFYDLPHRRDLIVAYCQEV